MENIPLLRTKLQMPQVPTGLVVRPRLLARLNESLGRPLTLVCAAAGFGKTTLVSSWLVSLAKAGDDTAIPAAWLSLDESDSELTVFLRYFIAALRTIFPGACGDTLELLLAQKDAPHSVLFPTFINELVLLPRKFVMVLDDHQNIRGDAVHDLLNEMVRHWPQPMHMVLISRHSPPLPMSSLRAGGKITEIGTRDLRFTPEEAAAYLDRALPGTLDRTAVALLEERTEGWIAGLQLATLSLQAADNTEAYLQTLSGTDVDFAGYLLDEVLSLQPDAVKTFLVTTSILNHFCAPLCEAVAKNEDPRWHARACIDHVERANLFTIALDNSRKWYRYHHLFREALQQRLLGDLGPARVTELHRKAATWFGEQGLMDEALRHAVAAGDTELADRLVGQGLRDVLNREDRPALEGWLHLLPKEFIRGRPWLLMAEVFTLQFVWQFGAQARVLDEVEALIEADGDGRLPTGDLQTLRGLITVVRGQHAYYSRQTDRAVALLHETLALLPDSWHYGRSAAWLYLGLSMQARGEGAAAERLLLERSEALDNRTDGHDLRILLGLAMYYYLAGQLGQAQHTARTMLNENSRNGHGLMLGWAHLLLGLGYYQSNDLDAAGHHFGEIVENRHTAAQATVRIAATHLALIHQLRGQRSEAWQMAELLSLQDVSEIGHETHETQALHARLWLLEGDLARAARWAEAFPESAPVWPLPFEEPPGMTRARILLARGTQKDLIAASQVLNALNEIADQSHNTRFKIEILALQAVALDAQGRAGDAVAALLAAIGLSMRAGFLRAYVDLGPPMQAMLNRLATRTPGQAGGDTVARILAAFPTGQPAITNSPASEAQASRPTAATSPDLIEQLTPRELEILTLMQEPMTVKEIARRLYISPGTGKRHVANVYGKLGVNRRGDALARARELGILRAR